MRAAPLVIVAALYGISLTAATTGQILNEAPVFTAAQAAAGKREVQDPAFACTDCHTLSLRGRTGAADELPALSALPVNYQTLIGGNGGTVPALVGAEFIKRWAGRTTQDLIDEFRRRFEPPMSQFSNEARLNMIAYVLEANGALPGSQPLTAQTNVALSLVLNAASR